MIFIWNRKSFPIKLYQHPQEIWGQMIDWKFFKNIFSTLWKSRKSTNLIKFYQNFHFLTFVIFVAEISNKHFCKLDKILRNFPSWHFFVFVTVFMKFGFEICNFKHWSYDILERYCSCIRRVPKQDITFLVKFLVQVFVTTRRSLSSWYFLPRPVLASTFSQGSSLAIKLRQKN